MKNKEIEELLNKLRKCRDYDDEVLLIKQYGATLLLSCIEQLENNRDKAIELCDFYNKKYQKDPLENQKVLFVISNVMNVLKGDSDE